MNKDSVCLLSHTLSLQLKQMCKQEKDNSVWPLKENSFTVYIGGPSLADVEQIAFPPKFYTGTASSIL